MRDWMGWAHIKDYRVDPTLEWTGVVDEERLKNFVPADIGDSGHEAILRDPQGEPAGQMTAKMQALGCPGVFLELEPHLKGEASSAASAGRTGWGSRSGRSCRVLDYVGIDYDLRTMDDIKTARRVLERDAGQRLSPWSVFIGGEKRIWPQRRTDRARVAAGAMLLRRLAAEDRPVRESVSRSATCSKAAGRLCRPCRAPRWYSRRRGDGPSGRSASRRLSRSRRDGVRQRRGTFVEETGTPRRSNRLGGRSLPS